MKTLIAYATKHGATKKYAEAIAKRLSGPVTLVDLAKDPDPDASAYDAVVIGGAIYVGAVPKSVKEYCARNAALLQSRRLGLFICYANEGQGQAQLETNFPAALRAGAVAMGAFGGEIILKSISLGERLVVRAVKGLKDDLIMYSESPLADFIAAIETGTR